MKRAVIIIILWMILIVLIDSVSAIRINEIMYNPEGNDNNKEFIEIFMDAPENLTGYVIADLASNDTLELIQYSDSNYALIVEEGFDFTGINASVYSAGATIGNNLDNTADEIFFYTPSFDLVASALYDGSIGNNNGYSMEFVDREWIESAEIGGTPGRENTASAAPEEPEMNGSQDNETSSCGIDFIVSTDKDLYNNSEKVKIDFDIEPEQNDFIIEYWIEDLTGKIAKSKYNTTNTNQKSWTPNIDESDKSFLVKADIYLNCSNEPTTISSEKLITVIGTAKPSESSITIKEIYLGEDESIEFGKALRVRMDIYKGDETSSTVQAWVEDLDSSEKISDISKLTLYEKFQEYDLTVPVQIKNNCDGKYSDGSYTLVVKGFDITETEEVRVEGIISSLCPESASISQEKTETAKISYEIAAYNEEIFAGERFTTNISIKNENKDHEFTLWSYVYRGSKCYSGEREENKVSVNLGPEEEYIVELSNLIEEAEPGDYKLKIKIQKDDLKTTSDMTKDIIISNPPVQENNSMDLDIIAIVDSRNKTENKTGMDSATGNVIYKSKSAKAKDLAAYFMIAAMAVMVIVLLLKYKKGKPKKKK